MDHRPPPPPPSAEQLFAGFLDRIEGGEAVDFDAFCRAHPAQAPALQRVHTRWQAMSRAFTQLSQQGGGAGPAGPAKGVDELKQKLASPGGRLARYALGREIARGAMGRIVSAWDEELRREVALKIHRGPVGDTRMQRRFLEEAQIAAQLDHPGIVPVHELGVDPDGRPFFSMQLVRGRDLGQILAAVREQRDGWSRTRVLNVLLRVCEAMAFAHDKGVVHRDLKPANIMVGRFGETYVMDWGLAHAGAAEAGADADAVETIRREIEGEDHESALLTRSGDVLGTPAYMAPEQAIGGAAVATPFADVYSLGAILYHLLAGDMPYAAGTRNADEVLAALRAGPPPPLPDDVPGELRAICERAMARDPAGRYAGMAELADDLRAFLEVRTVRAYATGRFAELRKWIARNRTLTTVTLAFVLALITGTIAVTALWVRADEDRQRADASAGRLQVELDRSAFQGARQALQLDNSAPAAEALWRTHVLGRMPRATSWALKELAERDPYLVTLPERGGNTPVAFGAGGDVVLVGGADGRLRVRHGTTLALLAELGDAGPRLTSVHALDTTRAVAGTRTGDLLVFDLAARRVAHRSRPHDGPVTCIASIGDGRFASAGADGRVLWWPRPEGGPVEVLAPAARIASLAIRPSGDGVLAGDDDGRLHGVAFGRSWRFVRPYGQGSITSIVFGDSDAELWIAGTDRQVRFVHLDDETREWVKPTRNGTGRQLARASDGSVLVGGWWRIDRMAADGSAFTPVALRGVTRMALSPDRRRLVTTNATNGMGLVDLAPVDRRVLAGVGHLALAPAGRRYATGRRGRVVVREVDGDALVRELPGTNHGGLRLDPDGDHVAVFHQQPAGLSVFAVATGELLHTAPNQGEGSGEAFQFAPDGSELAYAAAPTVLRRVRTRTGEVVAEHAMPDSRLFRIAWSHDGKKLAAVANDRAVVRVFDVATGTFLDEDFAADLSGEARGTVAAMALSHDGTSIAVGNWQGRIVVRRRGSTAMPLAGHTGTVWSLEFAAHDPGLLVSSGGAQGIACWDLDSAECCYQAIHDEARRVMVSRDGRTLVCWTPAGGILLDLSYRDRHIAGNLPFHLDVVKKQVTIAPGREAEVRAWAAEVMARPWPRWQ